jgi:hypothetical protein
MELMNMSLKKGKKLIFLTGLLFILINFAPVFAKEYQLFYLGGQSNMDGFGTVDQLPPELNKPVEDVMIFHGNPSPDGTPVDGKGIWAQLKPGHGYGFYSDDRNIRYSDRFGPELTFAIEMKKRYPDSNIAIIKYSRGGTSIHKDAAGDFGCWEPDYIDESKPNENINQYDHFLATVKNATAITDIDGDGVADKLVPRGIVWMQGESDANILEAAKCYQANLKRLMDLIRAAFRTDDLPVVIGEISDSDKVNKIWKYGDIVRQAQKNFMETDPAATLVTTTEHYGYSDPWHYDTNGYIDLGKQFALAMQKVMSP